MTIKSNLLLSNAIDMDILRLNMKMRFAHTYHHAHPTSLEDRAIPLCIPV